MTEPPRVASVVPVGPREVRVTFDRVMRENPDLVDPSKYVLTGGHSVLRVRRVGRRSVVLEIDPEMTPDRLLQLTVVP